MVITKSIKPNKQRKAVINAPLHAKKKMISSHLTKELRKKYGRRSISLRKGDTVKIMRGLHKGKSGKITRVNTRNMSVTIEGMLLKKKDGKEATINFDASNLMITELYKDDERRFKNSKSKATKGA